MALSGQKLNPTLVDYLRVCAQRIECGEVLAPAPATPSAYSDNKVRLCDRLTEAETAALLESFMAGASKPQLAKQYGISPKSVQRLLRRHGVQRHRRHEH